jgi:hypothetical protein
MIKLNIFLILCLNSFFCSLWNSEVTATTLNVSKINNAYIAELEHFLKERIDCHIQFLMIFL